jgi:hypothetical protein
MNDDFDIEIEGEIADIEVQDDTPEADRGREPMPKDIVDELEADELEEYSDKVKTRLKQMKKVWHDERREKERLQREQNEAIAVAQRILEENRRLKTTLSEGERTLLGSWGEAAKLQAEQAKRAYKEAYESGDSDKLIIAQDALQQANIRLNQLSNYQPTLQNVEPEVQLPQPQVQAPRLDPKTVAWQERNDWWGTDPEMTASALGLHQRLENERGQQYVGSDEYWRTIDTTMRKRFPEYFGEAEKTSGIKTASRNANVVAPASRSTSSKKIVLKQSQITIAKRLGLTPEQYAQEVMKMER